MIPNDHYNTVAVFIFVGLPLFPWIIMDLYFLSLRLVLFASYSIHRDSQSCPNDDQRSLITVLIPTYNNRNTVIASIAKTLNGLRQKNIFLPLDVTIIDSSTDGSEQDILEALKLRWTNYSLDRIVAKDRNLTLVHLLHRRGGKAWAINRAAEQLNTKYFAVVDSDWVLDFEPLTRAIQYLENNGDAVYAQLTWRVSNKHMTRTAMLDQISIDYRHLLENPVRIWRNIPVTIHGSAFVIRTADFIAHKGFRDSILSEDVDLTVRLMLTGHFGQGLADVSMQQNPCDHPRQFFWQKWRWIEGRSQLLREYTYRICRTPHLTTWQKIAWLFYLGYFGRFIAFTLILMLAAISSLSYAPGVLVTSCIWLFVALSVRLFGNLLVTMICTNAVSLWARLLEPLTFYGMGIVYSSAFLLGLLKQKGVWRIIESKEQGEFTR